MIEDPACAAVDAAELRALVTLLRVLVTVLVVDLLAAELLPEELELEDDVLLDPEEKFNAELTADDSAGNFDLIPSISDCIHAAPML